MKSVLHIAIIAPGGYSNAGLMKAFFENWFSEYTCFDYQEKIFNSDKEAMRRMLIQEAERLKPDLLFLQIQASDILDVQTFKRLSEISFTVNYTFDIRTSEQTEWLYNLAPVLGLICFSNQRDVNECKRRGYENVMCLQSSVDMEVYRPAEKERSGVVFIGNNFENTSHNFPLSVERTAMVEFLQKTFPDQFKVYGGNWNGSPMIMQKEEIEVLQSAAIAINQNNFDEELYTSDRIWRTISCGALCLTKYFVGIEKLLTRYEHLDWWESFDELSEKVSFYLSNKILAEEMAEKGMAYARVNHTWAARVKEMMDIASELKLFRDYVFQEKPDVESCAKAGAHVIDGVIPQPFDEKFNSRTCDCGKLIYHWQECGCQLKEWQLRAQENI